MKCKTNGLLRFMTRSISKKYFEDDGGVSGKRPSNSCWFKDYEPLYRSDIPQYLKILSEL
jgi:hypothetical protein